MKDVSNKILVGLLVVTIVASLAGTFVSLYKIGQISTPIGMLTGAAIGSGEANLTVEGTVDLAITDGSAEFGSGYYNASCTSGYAEFVTTGGSNVVTTCWLNTDGEVPTITDQSHLLTNNGTAPVTLEIGTNAVNAEEFLCEASEGCSSSDAQVQTKISQEEQNSCTEGFSASFYPFMTFEEVSNYTACELFGYADDADSLYVDFNITLPMDAPQGLKTLTVIYTVTAIES